MRRADLGVALALSIPLAVLSIGCSSPAPGPNSFTEVYKQVIQPTCTNPYCHYASVGIKYSALDMSSQTVAYWNLVNQECAGAVCAPGPATLVAKRVFPGYPNSSMMYLKVSMTTPPCGVQMPANPAQLVATGSAVFSGNALTQDQQQLIFNWIQDGAPNN